jgi:outer membrane protein OmpA-like peptidoglycan-associated protein
LNDIRRRLSRAAEHFRQAREATALAEVTLASPLAARVDALSAEAPEFAARRWAEAEKKFAEAARELEDGDVNDARRRGAEAERIYRDAELAAIKAAYLSETWELLRQAERMDVEDRAPKTLERAEELAREAERKLNESRYDTDEPRSLAQEARREARKAIHISERIRHEARDATREDLILAAEEPVRRIAGVLEIPITFEEGLDSPTGAILERIRVYQDSLQTLRNELAGREEMVAALEGRVAELEESLGGVEEERSALVERMEAQARLQQRFASVERMFTREEARIVRESDDVIVRLYGLTFPVGSATIEARYFPLLTKVQQTIRTFPGCRVTIEGHTDSFGGDEANQRLSQQRADEVRQYLLANMDFPPERMEAVGHGESRPIASNETAEGRTRNRRIDVVIHPRAGM